MAIKFNVIVREDAYSMKVQNELLALFADAQFVLDQKNPDYVFTIGGDGTFLKAVHLYLKSLNKISFIGIHTGTLGFFADFGVDDLLLIKENILQNKLITKDYKLVEATVFQGTKSKKYYAVNEVRIENVHHTLVLDVFLNDEHLETYRGNGILVCGQLGSSGYNKSLGGALIRRDLDLLQYTKIAAINNAVYHPLQNPLVLSGKDVLTFKGQNDFTFFGFDRLTNKLKDSPFEIKIQLSKRIVNIVHAPQRTYPQILKEAFLKR